MTGQGSTGRVWVLKKEKTNLLNKAGSGNRGGFGHKETHPKPNPLSFLISHFPHKIFSPFYFLTFTLLLLFNFFYLMVKIKGVIGREDFKGGGGREERK